MAPVLQASLDGGLRYLRGDLGSMVDGLGQFAGRFPGMQSWPAARILALVQAGREAEARGALELFARDGLANRPRDVIWLPAMAFVAEAAARLRETEICAELYSLMAPFSGRGVMIPSMLYLGPVDRFLGLLATALGETDVALQAPGRSARPGRARRARLTARAPRPRRGRGTARARRAG